MLDTKYTHQTHPSLLPLRMVLTAAERETPSRPPQIDHDEQLALELIATMRRDYDKPLPFICWKEESNLDIFHFHEVVASHA